MASRLGCHPADEATLFRELRTPRLPVTHVPVGYCGQHRRSCHSEESMTVTATTSCRTRTQQFTRRGRLQRRGARAKPECGPGRSATPGSAALPNGCLLAPIVAVTTLCPIPSESKSTFWTCFPFFHFLLLCSFCVEQERSHLGFGLEPLGLHGRGLFCLKRILRCLDIEVQPFLRNRALSAQNCLRARPARSRQSPRHRL